MEKLPSSKLNVKLIALDLDDTLLNKQAQVSDRNVRALQRAAAVGIYIVLCSGRAEDAILPFVRRLNLAGLNEGRFLIAVNGASVFDMHERLRIHECLVRPEVLQRANSIAEETGFKTEVYDATSIYMEEMNEWTELDVKLCNLKGVVVPDYKNFLGKGFQKMLIPGEPEKLLELQKKLKAELSSSANIFISKPYFLELLPPECGKGEAVSWLSNHLGIPVENTMGFGDSMNDESMIRMCGFGVAMENALPAIKDCADFVTEFSNDEDGVADFIEKFVL